jgi:hypothetical protein
MAIVFENSLPYDIRISGSANKGFILNVGCCTCVFTNKKEMLNVISDYIDDPKKMEKEYTQSTQNARPQVVDARPQGVEGRFHAPPSGRTMADWTNE